MNCLGTSYRCSIHTWLLVQIISLYICSGKVTYIISPSLDTWAFNRIWIKIYACANVYVKFWHSRSCVLFCNGRVQVSNSYWTSWISCDTKHYLRGFRITCWEYGVRTCSGLAIWSKNLYQQYFICI